MKSTNKDLLTEDETLVLTILEHQAKESIDEIAKQCSFSRQKVWRIIKNLDEKKIIWGYTAIADGHARNLKHFTVLAKRNNMPFDTDLRKEIIFQKIDDETKDLVKIEDIYYTHGIADWVITFYATDIIAAKKFVEYTFQRLNKYLQTYSILETLVHVRRMGLKNPDIEKLSKYL